MTSIVVDKENLTNNNEGGVGVATSTSFGSSSTSASAKLVADSKKFNASRIRRRMMEQQQQKQQRSKVAAAANNNNNIRKKPLGTTQKQKLLNNANPKKDTASVAPPPPPTTTTTTTSSTQSGLNAKKRNLPNLAITVSMSEDANDGENNINEEGKNLYGTNNDLSGMIVQNSDDDSTNAGNVSHWAMIEHYGYGGLDSPTDAAATTTPKHQRGNNDDDVDEDEAEDKLTPLWKPDSPSTIFHTAVGYQDDDYDDSTANSSSQGGDAALSTTAISDGRIFAGSPSPANAVMRSPHHRIPEWYTDENGELAQQSICTNESSFMNSPEDVPITPGTNSIFSGGDGGEYLDQDEKNVVDHEDETGSSTPPTSMLQLHESAIMSEFGQSTTVMESSVLGKVPEESIEESYDALGKVSEAPVEDPSYHRNDSVDDNASFGSRTDVEPRISQNQTQLSVASLADSESGNLSSLHEGSFGVSGSPQKRGKDRQESAVVNSPRHVDKDSLAAHARIEELEQNLKEQHYKAGTNALKLKDRVRELEHALRASVTTPKGSVMQEDPLKALLDRNHSLVKEVRFADQTCIEMSSKISAMEAKNQILSDQNSELQKENERLTKELASCRTTHCQALDAKQSIIDELMEHTIVNLESPNSTSKAGDESTEQELQKARKDLEDAKTRMTSMDENFKIETNKYTEKIHSLEEQLKQATDHMYLYQDGPTSPRLKNADRRVFDLEKELAHSKASVEALRNEIAKSRSSPNNEVEHGGDLSLDQSKDVIAMVHRSLSRILNRYKTIEGKVNETIDQYSQRIENLTTAVACLRSSLEFETDDLVSPQGQEQNGKNAMDAIINQSQYSQEDDQMLQFMEEARSPMSTKPIEMEENSSVDDISRLFSDDITLESVSKLEQSIVSPYSFQQDRYKQPLEIAIKECKRVKDIAIKLRTEVDSRKQEIEKLEIENGKLSLYASRQSEEARNVEKALEEARNQINELDQKLSSSQNENSDLQNKLVELEEIASELQKERDFKDGEFQLSKQMLKEREQQIEYFKKDLNTTREKLQEVSASCEQYKSMNEESLKEKDKFEKQITKQKIEEIRAVQDTLEETRCEVQTLKNSQEETMARLIAESQAKIEYQSQVQELQATQQQILSDAEDRLLEERYKQEDSRIEKADLKSRLTRKEKEFNSLKESFQTLQKRAEEEIHRRDTSLRSLKSQLSEFVSYSKDLSDARADFIDLMKSRGLTAGWVRTLSSLSFLETSTTATSGNPSGGANEVALWAGVLPNIASTIQKLLSSEENAEELQRAVDMLNDNIVQFHEAENQYKEQIKDAHEQNEKLYSLLHSAEQEMERSANQIRELTSALSRLQQQEAEALAKAESAENRLTQGNAKFANELDEMKMEMVEALSKISEITSILKEKEESIFELENHLELAQSQLSNSANLVQTKENESKSLLSKITSLEDKCTRLRAFIKKQASKCDEWAASYERQSQKMEKLETKNARISERATEISNRYHKLVGNMKRRRQHHKDDREKWTNERSQLHQVHTRLEEELEIIAKELSAIDPNPTS